MTATNIGGPASQNITVIIGPPVPPDLGAADMSYAFTVGVPFVVQLAASGSQPMTFALTGAPPELTLNPDNTLSGTITLPGSYTFTLTVTNVAGSSQQTVTIVVMVNSSAPSLTISKLQGSVKFNATGHDACALTGSIPNLPAGFNPSGVVVAVNVGDAQAPFNLNAKGQAKAGSTSFMLKLSKKFQGGPVTFTAKLANGSFATAWAAYGIDPNASTKGVMLTMPVSLSLGGTLYAASVDCTYSGKAGVGGKFKK